MSIRGSDVREDSGFRKKRLSVGPLTLDQKAPFAEALSASSIE
jgi:hypothetical protein